MVKKLDNKTLDEKLIILNKPILRVGNFKNTKDDLKFKCKDCGNEFYSNTNKVFKIKSHPCIKCSDKIYKFTNEIIDKILLINNRNVIRIGDVNNVNCKELNEKSISW